jgi:Tfp pilus assembly protein PilN
MKVLLNLLPEDGRALIRRKYHNRFFIWQSIMLLMVEILYVVLLFGVLFVLKTNHSRVEEVAADRIKTQADAKALGGYEAKFQDVNRLAAQSMMFSRNHLAWAELLVRLGGLVPENVVVTRLSTKDYQFSLSGTAKTRDDLLLFERNIKGDDCFTNFNLPVSNFFSQSDVDFQMNFSVKEDCVRVKL